MPDLISRPVPASLPPLRDREAADRAARRSLMEQIGRLESELAALFCSAYPRTGFDWRVGARGGGPRVLSMGELESLRDELAARVHDVRGTLEDRAFLEEKHRRRIEEMMRSPADHKWERIGNEDIGEPGCKHWHVRPRWGLLGMLMGWWRVRISSGCPLPRGRGCGRDPGARTTRPDPAWGDVAASAAR